MLHEVLSINLSTSPKNGQYFINSNSIKKFEHDKFKARLFINVELKHTTF